MVQEDPNRLVLVEKRGSTTIVTINRPRKRNCVNGPTSRALYQAFLDFEADSTVTERSDKATEGEDRICIHSQALFSPLDLIGCCRHLDWCR